MPSKKIGQGVSVSEKEVHPTYEAFEHTQIGDSTRLHLRSGSVSGSDFEYECVGGTKLSYGEIIALAGDFYGDPSEAIVESPNPHSWRKQFTSNVESLLQDTDKYLSKITSALRSQQQTIRDGTKRGVDPATTATLNDAKWTTQYTLATRGMYLRLAWSNYDHFGQEAVHAYETGHSLALTIAASAGRASPPNIEQLRQAYAYEAFAAHFLTDLFSAGHLRTPRRLLSGGLWTNFLSKDMHDEEDRDGLRVVNGESEEWMVYGDKHLNSKKGEENLRRVGDAVQASADEVFAAFNQEWSALDLDYQSAEAGPGRRRYRALTLAPDLKQLADPYDTANPAPLYAVHLTKDNRWELTRRVSVADRSDYRRVVVGMFFGPGADFVVSLPLHFGVGWSLSRMVMHGPVKQEISGEGEKEQENEKEDYVKV
ncbi:hypothetical protein SAICODRAFT_70228 [Saitoella complicata NRRL Y-17804]|nr:uncharacterized protein SAICODRAFT_70228 [Saitoella complicata NRRL Y-17804]ODQ54522.1 hypothetical protein SAICODRAFT_70228 [Saitoella complicata NRRL Y-17804]